jgi:hypothetical protein
MRTSPPTSKLTLIFGGFENLLTGHQSAIQHFPMQAVPDELAAYVQMVRDLLRVHANVSVYLLAPLYHSQPLWYESVYGETSDLFCSELSHLDPVRVKVVPPVDVSARSWTPLMCILVMPPINLSWISCYRHLWMAFLWTLPISLELTQLVTFYAL